LQVQPLSFPPMDFETKKGLCRMESGIARD